MSADPVFSLVVTIVDGGSCLRDFLLAVEAMQDAPPMEVIVPYDASIAETAGLKAEFPEVDFLDIGRIDTLRPLSTEAGQHELYDRRRAAGLARARGRIIGMLEDRGHPRKDWAATLMRLYAETGKNVIGGAILCREPVSLMNWAFYVTDFGRYGPPFESGPATWVTDVNVSYSRKALEDTRHIWSERFHEPLVHSYLMDQGEQLYLSNEVVVLHGRPKISLGKLLSERFQWGRLFGYIRTKQMSAKERLIYIAASPVIPPLLWVRHGRMQAAKGNGGRYIRALPYVMILSTAWTIGEFWGYVTRKP